MTLVVETGAGLPDANTYASREAADAYHLARRNDAWLGSQVEDEFREAALVRATEYLDGAYRMRWAGFQRSSSQALCWPRKYVRSAVGPLYDYLPSDAVPPALIRATCECALRELVEPGSLAPDQYPGEVVTSESIGPISVDYATGSGGPNLDTAPVLVAVERILAPLLRAGGGALVMRA